MTGSTNQFIHFEPTNTLSKIHPKNYNNSPPISKSWIRAWASSFPGFSPPILSSFAPCHNPSRDCFFFLFFARGWGRQPSSQMTDTIHSSFTCLTQCKAIILTRVPMFHKVQHGELLSPVPSPCSWRQEWTTCAVWSAIFALPGESIYPCWSLICLLSYVISCCNQGEDDIFSRGWLNSSARFFPRLLRSRHCSEFWLVGLCFFGPIFGCIIGFPIPDLDWPRWYVVEWVGQNVSVKFGC